MRVQFKFNEEAPEHERQKLVELAKQNGALSVEPLFPEESDPELASLYTAEYPSEADPEDLIASLNDDDAVEFAEAEPRRKLIGGEPASNGAARAGGAP